jgi:ribosomal protein L7/L12
VRAEEKELDGPELLRTERKDRDELVEEKYDQLPIAGEQAHDASFDQRGELLGAMRAILDGRELQLGALQLPQRELRALETLQAAKTGRDPKLDTFMYAEDREEMLEQALAILQTNLDGRFAHQLDELRGSFEQVVADVADLRRELHHLMDAEEELRPHAPAVTKAEGDSDDKPDDDAEAEDGEPKPSSLSGPLPRYELVLIAAPGKDPIDALRELRDLTGIGLREAKLALENGGGLLKHLDDEHDARTLLRKLEAAGYRVELRETAAPDEPEPAPVPSAGSSLTDETDDAAAAAPDNPAEAAKNKPWWKRPFG